MGKVLAKNSIISSPDLMQTDASPLKLMIPPKAKFSPIFYTKSSNPNVNLRFSSQNTVEFIIEGID